MIKHATSLQSFWRILMQDSFEVVVTKFLLEL